MKKTLLFLGIVLMTNFAFSQISFTDTLENEYTNGDTIALPYNGESSGDKVYFYVHNSSSSEIEYTFEIVNYYKPDGDQQIYVCANGSCTWAQSQNQQVGNAVSVAAGDYYTTEDIDVQYAHYGSTEDVFISIKVTNTADPNDTAFLTLSTRYFVGISEQTPQISKLEIFPNPVSEELNISYNNANQDIISIIDISGKIIQQIPINSNEGNVSVNISNYQQGVYFVQIGNESGKFIKN